jgi:hypothetical protein
MIAKSRQFKLNKILIIDTRVNSVIGKPLPY